MTAQGHERPGRSFFAVAASPQLTDIVGESRGGRVGPIRDIGCAAGRTRVSAGSCQESSLTGRVYRQNR
jgi:hypothetical protein